MNPVAIATKGKGPINLLRRTRSIISHYGVTGTKMDRNLRHFSAILKAFQSGSTFPLTAAALARSRGIIKKYQGCSIEFAVHGYYHIDHSQLSLDKQLAYFASAQQIFRQLGVESSGFRCPYLRWNADTITALGQTNFLYDSSQALAWDVVNGVETESYRRALAFYGAVSASEYPALPRLETGLVRIPYCLPDDEALVDRFQLKTTESKTRVWLKVLEETYRLGELFTLGLHPERIYLCEAPLLEILRKARELSPAVWVTRLCDIARWWKARTETVVRITNERNDEIHVRITGPDGITVLSRGVNVMAAAESWADLYQRVKGTDFSLRAPRRPFIGVSRSSSPYLVSFLRQQGYIVEQAESNQAHTFYLDRPRFEYADERPLLEQIERGNFPLLRLGRWPHAARSALCITGDIDALTLWDYGMRFLGT
jgi:peptidoglycan/xylan/chitin deacetylase (PgdA/CDA1 family)